MRPSTVRAASYPNLLKESFTTISVGAYLVTYDYNLQTTVDYLIRFSRALCENFATLQAKGHPKWREVEARAAEAQQGMDLLSAHRARAAQLHRREDAGGEAQDLHARKSASSASAPDAMPHGVLY